MHPVPRCIRPLLTSQPGVLESPIRRTTILILAATLALDACAPKLKCFPDSHDLFQEYVLEDKVGTNVVDEVAYLSKDLAQANTLANTLAGLDKKGEVVVFRRSEYPDDTI